MPETPKLTTGKDSLPSPPEPGDQNLLETVRRIEQALATQAEDFQALQDRMEQLTSQLEQSRQSLEGRLDALMGTLVEVSDDLEEVLDVLEEEEGGATLG